MSRIFKNIFCFIFSFLVLNSNLNFFKNNDKNCIAQVQRETPSSNFDLSFEVTKQNNFYKIENVNISEISGEMIQSFTISVPNGTRIDDENAEIPTNWTLQNNNNNVRNYFIDSSSSSISSITTYLESLKIAIDKNTEISGNIEVIISAEQIASRLASLPEEDGKIHYYKFVPFGSANEKTWLQCYNEAKGMTFKGLTGYLATITSQAEQDFIYNSIANQSGWLGGTRLLLEEEEPTEEPSRIDKKTSSSYSKINDNKLISENIDDYTYDTTVANEWYWACGPEAKMVFFNRATYSEGESGKIEGVFEYFDNPENQIDTGNREPNNSGENNCSEYCLQFAFSGPFWNDLGLEAAGSTVEGYFVEFSEYCDQTEENEDSENTKSYSVYIESWPQMLTVERDNISYERNTSKTEEEFFEDIGAVTEDGYQISSNFEEIVNISLAGNYVVTLSVILNSSEEVREFESMQINVSILPFPPFDAWDNGIRVKTEEDIFPSGSVLNAEVIENGTNGFEIIQQQIDNFETIEHWKAFEIGIFKNDQKIENFQEAEIWIPIYSYMDEEDIKVAFVTEGKDEIFENGSIQIYEEKKYYVFTTNHFSPYVLIDEITNKDKLPEAPPSVEEPPEIEPPIEEFPETKPPFERPIEQPKTGNKNNNSGIYLSGTFVFLCLILFIIFNKNEKGFYSWC
ncbi:MAG: hypothetical protein LBK29_04820 [Oscillospiraceae bacterium]|jgi:hypothetical protein|nr:hypothetical protein [Oscillospiraceae bacterium]